MDELMVMVQLAITPYLVQMVYYLQQGWQVVISLKWDYTVDC
jgi:hypothetical protein